LTTSIKSGFRKLNRRFLLTIFFLALTFIQARAQRNDSTRIMKETLRFIEAFNSLNWKPFYQSFSTDATIFFPDWEQSRRRSGRLAIDKTWLEIFPEFNDTTTTLRLNIKPEGLLIQRYGRTAIVTFHLGSGERFLARRTIVMVRRNRQWKITHLHASILAPPGEN